MRKIIRIHALAVGILLTSGWQDQDLLPETMPRVILGEPDPYYNGTEHIRTADGVIVAVVKAVVERGRPFPAKFSQGIYLQRTELVLTPEYAVKGTISGPVLTVRANLLSYESTRALGYRPFKPQAGERWILFLRRDRGWRMLFDLFRMGIRVYSGKPDIAAASRFVDVRTQTAAILVKPGHKVDLRSYCEGFSASAAYARHLVGPAELLRILETVEAQRGTCVSRVISEEIQSIRDLIQQRDKRPM
jgi:hypothetical protein